jgi:hypothetical protein
MGFVVVLCIFTSFESFATERNFFCSEAISEVAAAPVAKILTQHLKAGFYRAILLPNMSAGLDPTTPLEFMVQIKHGATDFEADSLFDLKIFAANSGLEERSFGFLPLFQFALHGRSPISFVPLDDALVLNWRSYFPDTLLKVEWNIVLADIRRDPLATVHSFYRYHLLNRAEALVGKVVPGQNEVAVPPINSAEIKPLREDFQPNILLVRRTGKTPDSYIKESYGFEIERK